MGTKVNSNYEDLITFTRASKGHALRPVSYGDELVENGTFNTDVSGWTETDATTVSLSYDAGRLRVLSTASYEGVYQDITTTVGRIYSFTRTVEGGTGTLRFRTYAGPASGGLVDLGGISAIDNGAGSTETFIFIATSTTTRIQMQSWNTFADFWLDNISVKEVLFDQTDGTLTLFDHPDDVPRVEYDADGNRLGLLVEEARTNEFVYSEAFNETNWQRPNDSYAASTLPFTEQSPTKVSNSAATLVDDSSGGTGGVYIRALVSGLTNSTPHTFSVFAKKDQLSYLALETKFFTVSTATVYFDLDAGTVGTATNCTGAIQAYPDGWYRCSLTFTTDASDTSGYGNIFVAEGDGDKIVDRDGTSSIFIFGAQFEEGSFPTSYMKNEGTASGKDRSADVASIPVADFGLNHSSYSMLLEAISLAPDNASGTGNNSNTIAQLKRGSTNYSSLGIGSTSTRTNRPSLASRNNAATILAAGDVASLDNTFDEGLLVKFSASFDVDSGTIAGSVNGSTVFSSTNIGRVAGVDLSFSDLEFRDGQGAVYIKSIKYYPRRLTNAQLQDLTS